MALSAQDRVNAAYKELEAAKAALKKGASLPIGGKATKMGEDVFGRNREAASKAYDARQNSREVAVETAEGKLARARADLKKDKFQFKGK